MATLYLSPATMIVKYLTAQGIVAQGGTLNTYVGGTVNTPLTTFTDATGLNANPNPMLLSSAGQPQSASGAPTEFWHASGQTLTLLVTDVSGNVLTYLPSLPAINDPSGSASLQNLLANPASGSGVDLVANAMKSYAVVANVQAAPVPALASTQTLIIGVQGGSTVGDGLGGLFWWNPTSTATDDVGVTTIAPSGASTGRYLRLFASSTGSFTGALTGMTATTQGTFKFVRNNNQVTLWIDSTLTGTSNSTAMTLTGLPAEIIPANQRNVPCTQMQNAGANYWGEAQVSNAGVVTFLGVEAFAGSPSLIGSATALFVASGTKGLSAGWTITYTL